MKFTPPSRFLRIARANRQGRAEVGSRAIYILPSRYGFGFALLLVLMLVGSINYTSSLSFLFTFLLAGVGMVLMIHTWRNLLGLQLQLGRCSPVFAGDKALFEIQFSSRSRREHPGLHLQLPGGDKKGLDLAAATSTPVTLGIETRQRGRVALPRLELSSRFPAGLLRAWCYFDLPGECLVYPRPGPALPPTGGDSYQHSSQGDRGVGVDDFVGIRPYHNGDSPRHIHWKALARGQALQTRQFGGDRSERRWLDWNEMEEKDIESRLSRLCRGVLDACDQGLEFGLRLPNLEIPPGRGQKHRHDCLSALALFGESP